MDTGDSLDDNLLELADLFIVQSLFDHGLKYYEAWLVHYETLLAKLVEEVALSERRSRRRKPKLIPRRKFADLEEILDDKLFKRMFRMKKEWFRVLVSRIEEKVTPQVFKSEEYLELHPPPTAAAVENVGGFVSGEAKVAMTIRMLAGTSYLDLLVVYGVKKSTLYQCFHEAISWILTTFSFPLVSWLQTNNSTALEQVSEGFAERSGGVFQGCIGALDGIAIRIKCPTLAFVVDPTAYFSRKGFYALNVQCICDAKKRVLWLSTGHKGSSHDSTALLTTNLYTLLQEKADFLFENRFFIAGDSAYPLNSFLIVPYNNALSRSIQDHFNFWHSSSRINIECCFGEVVMRWGIFWRKLSFSLDQAGNIIHAAFLLHNFIIEQKTYEDNREDEAHFRGLDVVREDHLYINRLHHHRLEAPLPLVTDNGATGRTTVPTRGRGDEAEIQRTSERRADEVRSSLAIDLHTNNLHRYVGTNVAYNRYGNVYTLY